MPIWNDKIDFSHEWRDACNSHNLDRIMAMYDDDVVFKSPRVPAVSGEESGIVRGKAAVREYWRKVLEKRPDLTFRVGNVFSGVDSIALEYRVGTIHGIEFMTLNADGLVSLAVGNDLVQVL
jgi:hypothetical protein